MINQLFGVDPLYTNEALHALASHPVICDDKARAELGHSPRPIEATLRDAYESFVSLGMLERPEGLQPPEPQS